MAFKRSGVRLPLSPPKYKNPFRERVFCFAFLYDKMWYKDEYKHRTRLKGENDKN